MPSQHHEFSGSTGSNEAGTVARRAISAQRRRRRRHNIPQARHEQSVLRKGTHVSDLLDFQTSCDFNNPFSLLSSQESAPSLAPQVISAAPKSCTRTERQILEYQINSVTESSSQDRKNIQLPVPQSPPSRELLTFGLELRRASGFANVSARGTARRQTYASSVDQQKVRRVVPSLTHPLPSEEDFVGVITQSVKSGQSNSQARLLDPWPSPRFEDVLSSSRPKIEGYFAGSVSRSTSGIANKEEEGTVLSVAAEIAAANQSVKKTAFEERPLMVSKSDFDYEKMQDVVLHKLQASDALVSDRKAVGRSADRIIKTTIFDYGGDDEESDKYHQFGYAPAASSSDSEDSNEWVGKAALYWDHLMLERRNRGTRIP